MELQQLIKDQQERNRKAITEIERKKQITIQLEKEEINQLTQHTAEAVRDWAVEEYNDIFKWLLGENGEFPDLSQKPHYSFRSELRTKLTQLQANKDLSEKD